MTYQTKEKDFKLNILIRFLLGKIGLDTKSKLAKILVKLILEGSKQDLLVDGRINDPSKLVCVMFQLASFVFVLKSPAIALGVANEQVGLNLGG